MKVIILAGGKATRLPNSAKDIPKSLVEVMGKPILMHQIEMLKNCGLSDIRLSLGYRSDQIMDYLAKVGEKYEYVVENEPLGTGGAIKYASCDLNDDFLAINGDVVSDLDFNSFLKFHQGSKEREKSPRLNSMALCWKDTTSDFGLVGLKDGKVAEFSEKPETGAGGFINTGIYILSPRTFDNIAQKSFSLEKEIFPALAKAGMIAGFIYKGKWEHLGTEKEISRFRE